MSATEPPPKPTGQRARPARWAALSILPLTACVLADVSFEGRACPCLEGWICRDGVCVGASGPQPVGIAAPSRVTLTRGRSTSIAISLTGGPCVVTPVGLPAGVSVTPERVALSRGIPAQTIVATAAEDAAIGQWPVTFEVRAESDVAASERVPVAFVVRGKPGTPDVSFGDGGLTSLGPQAVPPGKQAPGAPIARRKDGSLLVAWTALSTPPKCAVVALDPRGIRDVSFAPRAPAFDDAAGCVVRDLAVGPDDEVIVASSVPSDPTFASLAPISLSRFHRDGSPDVTFGAGGSVLTPVKAFGSPMSLVERRLGITSLGSIVISGNRTDAEKTVDVARYDGSGALDATFGAGGLVTLGDVGLGGSSLLQPDGRVLLPFMVGASEFRVARLELTGARDLAFAQTGAIAVEHIADLTRERAAVAPNGNIVVAGKMLFGFDRDGRKDAAFGDAGATAVTSTPLVAADVVATETEISLVLRPPYIVLPAAGGSFFLARTTPGGVLDEDFAPGGVVEIHEPDVNRALSLVVEDDGAWVITMYVPAARVHPDAAGDPELVVARFFP